MHSVEELGGIQDFLQAAALWIIVQHFGLAGLSSKHCQALMGEAVRPPTSQGNCPLFHSFLRAHFNFGNSDSGYMTASGPCPIFKGLVPVCSFVLFLRCLFETFRS